MSATEPKRPEGKSVVLVTDEERAILLERLKTLEHDRKSARPADEVFQRILHKPAP